MPQRSRQFSRTLTLFLPPAKLVVVLPPQIPWALIVAVALCVFLIFLLPARSGPFSVVHGPVTARRCKKVADMILLAMSLVLLAGRFSLSWVISRLDFLGFEVDELPATSDFLLSALRC